MKNLIAFSFFLCVIIMSLTACHDDGEEEKVEATRAVFMYLVADNSISGDIYSNIVAVEEGLKQVRSSGTFVIYWDGGNHYKNEFPQPTLFKYEVNGDGMVSKREIIQTYSEQNSVSPEVMLEVFKDMKELCPAKCYGLIFGSHASGWLSADRSRTRSFGDDDGNEIDVPDLADVLSRTSVHFDFILMDACLMSQVEVAYELKDAADYLILSPAEVMSEGFPYKDIVKYLLAPANIEQNLIRSAQGYIDFYRGQTYPWATIAVIKTDEIAALAALTHSIIIEHQENLKNFTSLMLNSFQYKYGFGRSGLDRSSYDFRAFIRELTDNDIPVSFEEQLEKTILFKGYVDDYPLVNIDEEVYSGIGCYIPYGSFSKWNAYFKTLQWYSASGWADVY